MWKEYKLSYGSPVLPILIEIQDLISKHCLGCQSYKSVLLSQFRFVTVIEYEKAKVESVF